MKNNIPDVLAWILIGAITTIAGYFLILSHWSGFFIAMQALAVSLAPYGLQWYKNVTIPAVLRLGNVIFMFATLILGQLAGFYITFHWWDIALHGSSSTGITLIGFILLVNFFRVRDLHSTPFLTSFLAFSFAMSIAVLWEVYEFLIDLFGHPEMPMQSDNFDTMTDMMIAIAGALIIVIPGYRYLRWHNRNFVAEVIEEGKQ